MPRGCLPGAAAKRVPHEPNLRKFFEIIGSNIPTDALFGRASPVLVAKGPLAASLRLLPSTGITRLHRCRVGSRRVRGVSCRWEVSILFDGRDQRTTQRRNRGCQRNPAPQTTGGATISGGATTTGARGTTTTGRFRRQPPYGPR
jgi:hypothetical protein